MALDKLQLLPLRARIRITAAFYPSHYARKPAGYKIEFIIRNLITACRNIDKRFYKKYDLVLNQSDICINIFPNICFRD